MEANEKLECAYEKPAVVDYGDLLELTAGHLHPPIFPQGDQQPHGSWFS